MVRFAALWETQRAVPVRTVPSYVRLASKRVDSRRTIVAAFVPNAGAQVVGQAFNFHLRPPRLTQAQLQRPHAIECFIFPGSQDEVLGTLSHRRNSVSMAGGGAFVSAPLE